MDSDDCESINLVSITELVEDYYDYYKSMIENSAIESKNDNFDGSLSERDAARIKDFATKNRIQPVSEALSEFLSLLEWHNQKKKPTIQETAIYNSILRLEKSVISISSWELMGVTSIEDAEGPAISFSDFEMNMMEQTISTFVKDVLDESSSLTLFFPLINLNEPSVIVKWRILEKIASVKITAEKTIYKQKLAECIKNRIETETKNWLRKESDVLKLTGKVTVMKDAENLAKILKDLISHLSMALDGTTSNYALFAESNTSYLEAVATALDDELYPLCQQVMTSMDEYQISHKDFHVNIRDSCALSHALYRQLKKLVNLLKIEDGRTHCRELESYSNLFGSCFLNLLHVLKSECHFRIKRAVEVESKDTVHTEERILSSSVIVLNCFCTVMDEWKHLEIEDEELKTAFLIKVTDIICDGAKILAEALDRRLEYSSESYLKSFEHAKKACILVNSIEHVMQYLQNLPHQMHWEDALDVLKGDQSNSSLKEQIMRILNLIHVSMDSHLKDIEVRLMNSVVSYVQHRSEKFLSSWLHSPVASQNVEKLLNSLNEDLETFHKCFKEELFPKFLHMIWTSFLTFLKNNFQDGQPPEYAKIILQNLEELKNFFLLLKMEDFEISKALYDQVNEMLSLNSKTTVELQLDYYSQLAELMISPIEYLGHIAFQAGYKCTGSEMVNLYINVQKGQRLPIRKFDMSELYVKVELCPNTMFPSQLPLKSEAVTEAEENPLFNEFFQFSKLPSSLLSVKGAVIQVLVLNQDRSYSAEAVLPLSRVQNMSCVTSIEFLPVYLMPLRKFDMSHISFQVLVSRSRWDRSAKLFISKRAKIARTHKKFLTCLPGKNIMCNFASSDD